MTSWDCVPLREWMSHVRTANPRVSPFLVIYYLITFLPSIKQTKEQQLRSAWTLPANTRILSSHICGYSKACLWQVVGSVSVLIASVLWESCWIQLDISFLNLSALILGLSVDLSIPQKKLVCVRNQSRGVLNCFKAISRVIPFLRWGHKCSCQLSAQHSCCPWSNFVVCDSLCLILRVQTRREELCILLRENQILNIIHILASRHRSLLLELA